MSERSIGLLETVPKFGKLLELWLQFPGEIGTYLRVIRPGRTSPIRRRLAPCGKGERPDLSAATPQLSLYLSRKRASQR